MIYKYNSTESLSYTKNGQNYTYAFGDIIPDSQISYMVSNWSGRILIVQDPSTSYNPTATEEYRQSIYWPSRADLVSYNTIYDTSVTSLQTALDVIFNSMHVFSTGLMGPTGPKGPTGSYGGPMGPTGRTGIGQTGPTGPIGSLGPTGGTGIRGFVGPTGLMGPANGPCGPTGPMGKTGVTGNSGPMGPTGNLGMRIKKFNFTQDFGTQELFVPDSNSIITKVVVTLSPCDINNLPRILVGTRSNPSRDFDILNSRLEGIGLYMTEPYSETGDIPFEIYLSISSTSLTFTGVLYIWYIVCD
jgi:hypothetical protein